MNLLIFDEPPVGQVAVVNGYQAEHLIKVCQVQIGDKVRVGIVNGAVGTASVENISEGKVSLVLQKGEVIPNGEPLTIFLALPRPQMLKRIFQKAATFGVERIVLFRSAKVEKSYFDSNLLQDFAVRKELVLGLEQGAVTRLPEIKIYSRFKQFLSEESEFMSRASAKLICLPNAEKNLQHFRARFSPANQTIFSIGPEGGFSEYEEGQFTSLGFEPVKLAKNILRVESAFDFAIAQYALVTATGAQIEAM